MKQSRDTLVAALFFAGLLLAIWLVCQALFTSYTSGSAGHLTGDQPVVTDHTVEEGQAPTYTFTTSTPDPGSSSCPDESEVNP